MIALSPQGMTGSDVYICYKKSMNRADLISYKPTVLSRYPLRNNALYALEETVALFCLPMGANLECWPATSARASSVTSSFVLTLANRDGLVSSLWPSLKNRKMLQLGKYIPFL